MPNLHKALLVVHILLCLNSSAQERDSSAVVEGRVVTLSPVIVRSGTDIQGFIKQIRQDTSFYKAFRNLRVLRYHSLNDVRMMNKKGTVVASLNSRTQQWAARGCRVTQVLEQEVQGDYFDRSGEPTYYTAAMYEDLFFAKDTVCGESNVVGDLTLSLSGKKGMARHKEQLKMLFFNPGAPIPGIPLMGDKVAVFAPGNSELYDFSADIQDWKGQPHYIFSIRSRPGLSNAERDRVVIDEMVTWFDYQSLEVRKRTYSLSYQAAIYSFDVHMEVEIEKAGTWLYPAIIRYDGQWKTAFRKREKGVFTATLFNVGTASD